MDDQTYGRLVGERTERRFVEAFKYYTDDEPAWFFGIEEAPVVLDLRGVDFIAWVKYPRTRDILPVPIQVKSSQKRADAYYDKHPEARAHKVVVIVVPYKAKPGAIRRMVFDQLKVVRTNKTSYYDLLVSMGSRPVSEAGKRLFGLIEQRRAMREKDRRPRPPPGPTQPLHKPLILTAPRLSKVERWWYRLLARVRTYRQQQAAH